MLITVTLTYSQNSIHEKTLVYENGKIDFIESYLNLCLLVDSTIDKQAYLNNIDLLCTEAEEEIRGYRSPEELIEKLNNFIFVKKGFKYNKEANIYYFGKEYQKKNIKSKGYKIEDYLLMPNVLKTREGICISLSFLYLTIAYKLELPIFGVISPNHFFTRYNDGKTMINIESTNVGKEFSNNYYLNNSNEKYYDSLYLNDLNLNHTIGIYALSISDILSQYYNIEKAIKCYNLSIEINPNLSDAYINRGNAYIEIGKYEKAIADHTKAIEINPFCAEAFYNRGNAFIKQDSKTKAIKDYTKAIELNPQYVKALNNRAVAYFNQDTFDKAIADLTKVIEIDPENGEAYYNRGKSFSELSQPDKAITDLLQAIRINPNDAMASYYLGLVYAEQDSTTFALAFYTKAIEIDSGFIDAYYNRGKNLAKVGIIDWAIEDFTAAIEKDHNYIPAYFERGLLYYQKGNKDKACSDWEKVAKLGYSDVLDLMSEFCE